MATNGAYELPLTLIVRGYVVRYLCESITPLRLLACGTIVLGFVTLCEAPNIFGGVIQGLLNFGIQGSSTKISKGKE